MIIENFNKFLQIINELHAHYLMPWFLMSLDVNKSFFAENLWKRWMSKLENLFCKLWKIDRQRAVLKMKDIQILLRKYQTRDTQNLRK